MISAKIAVRQQDMDGFSPSLTIRPGRASVSGLSPYPGSIEEYRRATSMTGQFGAAVSADAPCGVRVPWPVADFQYAMRGVCVPAAGSSSSLFTPFQANLRADRGSVAGTNREGL